MRVCRTRFYQTTLYLTTVTVYQNDSYVILNFVTAIQNLSKPLPFAFSLKMNSISKLLYSHSQFLASLLF